MSESAPVLVEQLSFRYARGLPWVLEHVDLRITQGDFVGLIGPNGGGKTTLLRVLLGLERPTRGRVRIFGASPRSAAHRIGYVPQGTHVDSTVPHTVREVVLSGTIANDRWGVSYRRDSHARAEEAMRRTAVLDLADRPFQACSGGQRQRILISRALANEARLLILDEPMTGVDPHQEHQLLDLLRELHQRMPIVVVSHDIGFVSEHVTHVACLNRQMVVHAADAVTRADIEAQYHDHGLRAVHHHDEQCPVSGRSASNEESTS